MDLDADHFVDDGFDYLNISRLRNHLVHLVSPSLLNVLFLSVASTCNDLWLKQLMLPYEGSYQVGGFIAVHDRHATIHENETIVVLIFIV